MAGGDFKDWLDLEDDDQCEWLAKYFRRKGYYVDHSNRSSLMQTYLEWVNRSTVQDNRLANIKAAWSTYRSRTRNSKVSLTVMMTKSSKKTLYSLANSWGMTVPDALEKIIQIVSGADQEAKNEEQKQAEIHRFAKKLRKSVSKRVKPPKESESDRLKKRVKALEEEAMKLKYEYCCAQVMLEESGLQISDLTEYQADKAQDLFQKNEVKRLGLDTDDY